MGDGVMAKQVWISNIAYYQARKIAFDLHKPIGQIISDVIMYGVKVEEVKAP